MVGKANGYDFDEPSGGNPELLSSLGYYEWRAMFTGVPNDIFSPDMSVQYQDMSRPITDYYISSSHNTYLEGNQLLSKASTTRYSEDLLNGVRCVEMDVWDGPHGEPVIYHGCSMTGKITLHDALRVIHKNAFEVSPFPVIINLQNNCSRDQQARVADLLKKTFRDQLAIPKEIDSPVLPSPLDLKNKILIRSKHITTKQDAFVI